MRTLQDEPLQIKDISLKTGLAYTKTSSYLSYLIKKGLIKREQFAGKYYFRITRSGYLTGQALKIIEEKEMI